MTPDREEKLRTVAGRRQVDITVVLEDVHDPHNISAVLRSCDAVGIARVFLIYTDPRLQTEEYLTLGHKSSAGTRKWIKTEIFTDLEEAVATIREQHSLLMGAALRDGAVDLFDLDLTENLALVFGNEQRGISPELHENLDGTFSIPQYGLVQSLNISVACAVTMFEAMRQRTLAGNYQSENLSSDQLQVFEEYKKIHRGELSYYPKEDS